MNFLNSNSCRPSIMCQGLGLSVFFFFRNNFGLYRENMNIFMLCLSEAMTLIVLSSILLLCQRVKCQLTFEMLICHLTIFYQYNTQLNTFFLVCDIVKRQKYYFIVEINKKFIVNLQF